MNDLYRDRGNLNGVPYRLRAWLYAWLALCLTSATLAQAPDVGFNPGADNSVYVSVVQPDGKLLVAGAFTQIAGQPYQRVARLLVNGQADPGFAPLVVDGAVFAIAAQADGKILIGGLFSQVGAALRNRIARLNADGSLDTGFDPGSGANNSVFALALQPDGRVLLGGNFTTFNGVARNRIARLNADGSLDTGFDPGLGANGAIFALALQADGRVLLGGDFTNLNGIARNRIARLNAEGSPDTSFDPGSGANFALLELAVQADGRVLLGGQFSSLNGVARNFIGRLHANGSLDTGFNPGTGANLQVNALAVQADGRVLLGGEFTTLNGVARNRIARLNTDGSLDTGFNPSTGASNNVHALAVQADGRVLLGGNFSVLNGVARNYIGRLNANGSLDTGFNPGTGPNDQLYALALQADGRVLLGGNFSAFDGVARSRIARLNTDGSLDTGFDPGTGPSSFVFVLAVQADGRLLLGGLFTSLNGVARNRIARLNADGSLDTGFNPGAGASGFVSALAVQADGRVLLGGDFTTFNGVARNRIARVNADGSLDTGFNPGTGANGQVSSFAVQADGRVLLGGSFTTFNGVARNRIARLNVDGSLDIGFNPGTGANGTVDALALQADGRVLLGGSFTTLNGVTHSRVARWSTAEAALQSLSLNGLNVRWQRAGSAPELALPPSLAFSISGNPGTFAPLGTMSRIVGGWQLAAPTLPAAQNFFVRAEAATASGGNGSSGRVQATAQLFLRLPENIFANGFE